MSKLAFFASAAGASVIFGFGMTVAMAKKKDPSGFLKGMSGNKGVPESGVSLALRALGYATVISVGGFSIFCFTVWKLMGVHSLEEFRTKVQESLPRVSKEGPRGKSDFKTIRELVHYLIEEDERKKRENESKTQEESEKS